MVKVSWSNQFAVAVQQINIHKLNDTKVSLQDRISTFEGPIHLVNNVKITSTLAQNKLELVCNNISKHVVSVSGGNIHIIWMTLYFKMDNQGKWWLLYCSRIKVRDYFKKQHNEDKAVKSPRFVIEDRLKFERAEMFAKTTPINMKMFCVLSNTLEKQLFCLNCLSTFSCNL